MKKKYFFTLLLTLSFFSISFAQQVFLTGYVDATCTGAKPRAVEIYVSGTVNLTDWKLQRQSNGGGYTSNISLTNLGTITDAFAYVTNDSTLFDFEFGINTNVIQNSGISSNGDDAFQIVNASNTVVDRFGEENVDGSGKPWEHEDTYYYRKDGATPNAGTFDVSNWIIGAKNLLDNTCGTTLKSLVPFGTFKMTATSKPSLKIASPLDGTKLSATTNVSLLIGVSNFNVAANGSGDGYIKWKIDGVAQADKFNVADEVITVVPGNSYTVFMELVDNSGNPLSSPVSDSVTFTVELPCLIQLGDSTASCDLSTKETDTYSVSMSFNDGNTGTNYTITAKDDKDNNVGVIAGDNPNSSSSGSIIISGIPEGTNITVKVIGDASKSSCDFTRNITSPICNPLPIFETFSYSENQNLISNSLWKDASTSNPTNDIQVIKNDDGFGNPILGNYYGSNDLPDPTGNFVRLDGKGSDPFIGFESKASGVVYASFLFHITNMDGFKSNANGGYFAVLTEASGSFKTRLWVKDPTAGGTNEGLTFQLGVSVNGTASTVAYSRNFTANLAEPVFAVISYDFSNHVASLWVVPDASSFGTNTPPAKSASVTATGNEMASNIGRFLLRQDSDSETPTIDFDELRIGTSWKEVTSNATVSINNNVTYGFALYPNPVTDNILTLKSLSSNSKEVHIFNVLGKRILSSIFTGTKKYIDVSELDSGVYILQVKENGKTATKKLVIQ
ncbi:T9SS type A sorting domain-containing protein [Polaribacter aquimarinus]|uniref:Secretion system C-terminal sorting domain-containing protein n=1 Tax=Polaribacter aquimarinus TaxID=2100726 RepID=A0A2U2JB75_9FLAO|nr:T9SS type A sorting domain-containing protein [Polaribacter aquimarinus]PWG05590.1 hypothetical protein DIS07_03865 [Polaribacter aquimarinus]